MLTGKRPKECDYCWNVEDNSNEYSDRIYKSSESWSRPFYKEIVDTPWNRITFQSMLKYLFQIFVILNVLIVVQVIHHNGSLNLKNMDHIQQPMVSMDLSG